MYDSDALDELTTFAQTIIDEQQEIPEEFKELLDKELRDLLNDN